MTARTMHISMVLCRAIKTTTEVFQGRQHQKMNLPSHQTSFHRSKSVPLCRWAAWLGGRASTSSRPHTYLGSGCPTRSAKWPLWLKPPASTEALSSLPHNRARIRTSGSIADSLELPSHPAGGHYHLESTTIFLCLFGFLWLGMMHIRFITVKLCIGLL